MEKRKVICGVQQVGIGVRSVDEAWPWYKDVFGVDIRILGDVGVAERMLPYTGGKPQPRYAILVINLQGGKGRFQRRIRMSIAGIDKIYLISAAKDHTVRLADIEAVKLYIDLCGFCRAAAKGQHAAK